MQHNDVQLLATTATSNALNALSSLSSREPLKYEDIPRKISELQTLSAQKAELDETRKSATRPLDEAKKTIMAWFKPAEEYLGSAIAIIKSRISAAEKIAAERDREIALQAVLAMESGDDAKSRELASALSAPVDTKGIIRRKIWRYEIVDESIIPRQYLVVNSLAITAAVRHSKNETSIPGVRVYSEDSYAVNKE